MRTRIDLRCAHVPRACILGMGWRCGSLARATCLAIFLALGVAVPASHAASRADPVLAQAHAAWRAKNLALLSDIARRHRDHTLAPYFEYWKVLLAPETATIRPYLQRYPKTALAEQLRADWIRGLGRQRDWTLIVKEARYLAARENDVRCWVLRARWELGDRTAAREVLEQWRQSREYFEPCLPVARSLVQSGQVSPVDVWTRARRLAEAGNYGAARRLLSWLPTRHAPPRALVDMALGKPDQMLARGALDTRLPVARELLAFALVRVANDDADRAARRLTAVSRYLSPEQRGWVHGHLGLLAARRLHTDSLDWYRASTTAKLSDEHYGWWVRAAARESAWTDVWLAVERMTLAARAAPTWQYWLGRSMAARGQRTGARHAYSHAARDTGFYGILAREALGYTRVVASAPPTAEEIAAAARDPSIRRTVALLRADLRTDGLREWAWAVRRSSDRQLLAAAHFFEQVGLWDRVVETAERTERLFDLRTRYPLAHRQAVRSNAAKARVDPALVFSVARQESRFYPHARSLAGAIGLIQVMPSTGTWIAKKLGLGGPMSRLSEIDFNLRVGSQYLRTLLDDLRHPLLAFAAYNAGPGRALNWLGDKPMDAAAYAESIPLDETREYTKHVAANAYYYRTRFAGKPVSLSQFLGSMPPAHGATVASRDPQPPAQVAVAESASTIRW